MPGGLSAKQQKLFELRMRMVRGLAPRNARAFLRHDPRAALGKCVVHGRALQGRHPRAGAAPSDG